MDGFRTSTGRPGPVVFAILTLLLWLGFASPASAAVELRFHSKEMGHTFPHAFIVLSGTLDSTGEAVDANFGFTLRHLIGPSVLFGPVQGLVEEGLSPDYIRNSNLHFTLTLTDDEYRQVLDLVERWRALPQPSYRLDRRNCVTFVAEVAALFGLRAETRGVMRRPRAFLNRVREQNLASITSRGASAVAAAR